MREEQWFLLKKQLSILSGILSGRSERVTKCQFLIKGTLSEATSPFNAQLNDSKRSGNQHITAYYVSWHAQISRQRADRPGEPLIAQRTGALRGAF